MRADEVRARISAAMRIRGADPQYRRRVSEGVAASWERRRAAKRAAGWVPAAERPKPPKPMRPAGEFAGGFEPRRVVSTHSIADVRFARPADGDYRRWTECSCGWRAEGFESDEAMASAWTTHWADERRKRRAAAAFPVEVVLPA